MLASVAIPASMMTNAPFGAVRPLSMSSNVVHSATLPANIFERRTNPLASSTSPRVTSGQSDRFSFERPRAALGMPGPVNTVAAPVMMSPALGRATAPPAQMFHWQGEVLGALSELTLWHTDAALSRRTILKVRAEIARYERIFSLYQPESEISRLNAAGALRRPAPELRALLHLHLLERLGEHVYAREQDRGGALVLGRGPGNDLGHERGGSV